MDLNRVHMREARQQVARAPPKRQPSRREKLGNACGALAQVKPRQEGSGLHSRQRQRKCDTFLLPSCADIRSARRIFSCIHGCLRAWGASTINISTHPSSTPHAAWPRILKVVHTAYTVGRLRFSSLRNEAPSNEPSEAALQK